MWGLRKDELSMSWQFPNPNPLLSQLHHSLGVALRCHVLCRHVWKLVDELWNLCRYSLNFIKFCQINKINNNFVANIEVSLQYCSYGWMGVNILFIEFIYFFCQIIYWLINVTSVQYNVVHFSIFGSSNPYYLISWQHMFMFFYILWIEKSA